MDSQLLERFVGWVRLGQDNPQVSLVDGRELSGITPLFSQLTGDIAEFYSRVVFDKSLFSATSLYLSFEPFESLRERAAGWVLFKNRETGQYELDPAWDFGECVFFAREIGDGVVFVQLDSGIVYGMIPGGWEKDKLAPSFELFLRAFLDIADAENEIPAYLDDDTIYLNPAFVQRAEEIGIQILGEEYWPEFREFFGIVVDSDDDDDY